MHALDHPWSAAELRQRIQWLRDGGERLDQRDYFGRNWLAQYAADADVIADCLEELLNQGVVLSVSPFATELAPLLARAIIPMHGC